MKNILIGNHCVYTLKLSDAVPMAAPAPPGRICFVATTSHACQKRQSSLALNLLPATRNSHPRLMQKPFRTQYLSWHTPGARTRLA